MSRDTGDDEEVEAIRSTTLLQQVRKETASSSSSSADPEPKKPRKFQAPFDREASQFQTSSFDNPVNLIDVLPQIQAGSDAANLHPQTPFTSYVSRYSQPSHWCISDLPLVCFVTRLTSFLTQVYDSMNV